MLYYRIIKIRLGGSKSEEGREFDTSKLKRILQSLETGLFFCQIFVFII